MRVVWTAFAGALVLAFIFIGFLGWMIAGDRSLPVAPVTVTVPSGDGIGEIGQLLRDAGVIRADVLLKFYAKFRGVASRVNAADYDFPAHQTLVEVVDRLASGGHPSVVWVTIPEGYTAREIAHRLAAQNLGDPAGFIAVVNQNSLLFGGALTRGLEGYLYPDTYQIRRDATPQAIATQMTDQFRKKLPKDYERLARHIGLSLPEIVTVASIIEREAKLDSERRLMASVYYNRLKRGMPLEVDATIEYALPQHKNVLHYSDLAVDSPYNTYAHIGLPPTPISNPGIASIQAALHPAHTEYLYYVYAGGGHHHFSHTLAEQQAAERRYLH